jgi:hypothetical protein
MAGRWHGRAIRLHHSTKGPGPSGSLAAGVQLAALLTRTPSTRSGPRLPATTAATERRCFNKVGSCYRPAEPE